LGSPNTSKELGDNKGETMKSDEIPFNKWSKARIKLGKKKGTARHKKYLNDPRVLWISPKLPWWFI